VTAREFVAVPAYWSVFAAPVATEVAVGVAVGLSVSVPVPATWRLPVLVTVAIVVAVGLSRVLPWLRMPGRRSLVEVSLDSATAIARWAGCPFGYSAVHERGCSAAEFNAPRWSRT